jgi:DNA-binding NtrC family response regulator
MDTSTQELPRSAASPLRILLVDDEESMRHYLGKGLRRNGYAVTAVGDGESAILQFARDRFDVVVLDLRMPGVDGLEVLARIRASDPQAVVVLMTAHGSISTAVEAMRLGAADFLAKPFELDELALRLDRALAHRRISVENQQLRGLLQSQGGLEGLVGRSNAMQSVAREIELLRDATTTVLVTGDAGTGKGVVARALHMTSSRRDEPFVVVHCPSVRDDAFEATLFGSEGAGSGTPAASQRLGPIAKAHRGTLFLDAVGDVGLEWQGKLERFLQERTITPVGGTTSVGIDVRIVAATHHDLAEAVGRGAFRASLLWRLDVVRIHVPPLRDRRDDIPLLVHHHLRRLAQSDATPPKTVTAEALRALSAYDWPGNVRELENLTERMAVLAGARQVLSIDDLPAEIRGAAAATGEATDYEAARRRFDQAYFDALLERCNGSVPEAARIAGISAVHLRRRLRDLRGGDDGDAAQSGPST